jgi:MFS family permease
MWGAAIVRLLAGTDEPWRWVFAVNIPLGLLAAAAIIAARRFESAATNRSTRGRLDLLGTLLLAIALLGVNLALASGSEIGAAGGSGARALGGTRNPLADQAPLLLVVGLIAGVLFVLWERRARDPVLPLALFRHRRFSAAIVANFLVGAALIVAMVDTPVVVALLVDADRVSSVSALMLAPFTLLMAALSFAGGQLVRLRGERLTAAIGLALVAIGYVALWVGFRDRSYTAMIPGLAIAGAGFGLVIAPIGATTIEAAAASERGIAAGLTLVFRLLGMTIGISVLTSIAVRRLQTLVSRLDLPVRQPDESTAAFLLRQNEFITDRVIPLSLQVIRESFLIAGVLALVALVPISYISHRPTGDVD